MIDLLEIPTALQSCINLRLRQIQYSSSKQNNPNRPPYHHFKAFQFSDNLNLQQCLPNVTIGNNLTNAMNYL